MLIEIHSFISHHEDESLIHENCLEVLMTEICDFSITTL